MKNKHFVSPLFGSSLARPAGETDHKAYPQGYLCGYDFELLLSLSDLIVSDSERKIDLSNHRMSISKYTTVQLRFHLSGSSFLKYHFALAGMTQ